MRLPRIPVYLAASAGVFIAVTLFGTLRALAEPPTATKSLRIGLQKQLLVDDLVIDKMANLTRELGNVTKAKKILKDGSVRGKALKQKRFFGVKSGKERK